MEKKRASIQNVAEMAGVSIATVSRYFNARDKVSDNAAARIERAIETLQYTNNSTAYNNALKRPSSVHSREIAIVGRDLTNQHFWRSYIEADSLACQHGYVAGFYNLGMSQQRQTQVFDFLAEKEVAGIIALTMSGDADVFKALERKNIPVVLMDSVSSDACNVIACLKTNVYSGTYMGTEYLLNIAHKKIAFLNGPSSLYTSKERLQGYLDAIRDLGNGVEPIFYNIDINEEAGYEKTVDILLHRPDVTAIFPSTNQLTSGCYRALSDYHVAIPEQISLMGFDDIGNVQFFNPPLTVVSRPHIGKKGYAAMSILLSYLESRTCESLSGLSFDMPMEIKIRQSCAPPKTTDKVPFDI